MGRGRKRSLDEYEGDNLMGVGDTLKLARAQEQSINNPAPGDSPTYAQDGADQSQGASDGGWQKVERSKRRKKTPKKDSNNYPSISHSSQSRLQSFVKISDMQNLILYLLADGTAPQWCSVRHHANVKKVVALMVPGLEAGMFDGKISLLEHVLAPGLDGENTSDQLQEEQRSHSDGFSEVLHSKSVVTPDDYYPKRLQKDRLPEPLQPLGDIFELFWPIKTPGDDKFAKLHSPLAAMLSAPVVKTKEEKKAKGPQPPAESKNWRNQRTPVTELVASTEELLEEGYTLHPAHFARSHRSDVEATRRVSSKTAEADGWLDTPNIPSMSAGEVPDKDIEKGSITAGRKMLAIDCEMCITSPPGRTPQVFSLTRVSLIDWDCNVVLDELVKPADPITDYLTPYSGMTPALLENVTTTLSDVQQKLRSIITPQTILIGHSMNSDLNALQLTHPFIIDTTLLFPHPRGPPLKSSLKWLAQKYLSREIQKGHGSTGHDSIEDARACLDLVKQKCEKGKTWGTPEASSESIFKRLSRSVRPKRDKANPGGDDEPRLGAVVDWGDPTRGYGAQAKVAIGCNSDDEVFMGIKSALSSEGSDPTIPPGGCDFIWGRLRELEARREWWDASKNVDSEALRTATAAKVAEHSLAEIVQQTVQRIHELHQSLPPCTALLVYTGSADPRPLREMQALQQRFKDEYKVKKWDQLSVRWTDVEEQKLRRACEVARRGLGFITVK